LKDKIVIVGTTFSGGTDIGPTPLETQFPLSEIHSHAVNTILTQKFIHPLPSWVGMLIVLLLTLLIGRLSLRFKPLLFAGLSFLVLISFLGGTFILFMSKGYLVNVTHPFLGILLCYSSITLYKYTTEEIEKKRLKQVFQRYVSHQVMEMILNNPEEVSLGGRRKELTILFADIKDFTKYSDGVEPEEVVEFLTEYFDRMTEIIFEYGGTVDKLIGDGILAFFGDPVSYTDHAQRAVSAGLKMRQSLRDISKKRVNEGKMPLEVRIGINTGYVTVGNMGSDRFMDYTVIGNNVNLAARLEQAAAPGQIIVSHRTYSLIKNKIKTNFVGEISLKGLGEEKIYEVIE
jgi:adenylate cyclase